MSQVDNRGSDEVGPIRSTLLASLRGLARRRRRARPDRRADAGPAERVRLRRAPATAPRSTRAASMLSVSGSYGRSQSRRRARRARRRRRQRRCRGRLCPPADAQPRAQPVGGASSSARSACDQTLSGTLLRDDRLATLTGIAQRHRRASAGGSCAASSATGRSACRSPGVTREGDARISRGDGDARFVTWRLHRSTGPQRSPSRSAIALASAGQLASRPLLATAEIGAGRARLRPRLRLCRTDRRQGHPGLGRAARRHRRASLRGVLDRTQLYGFVDGGYRRQSARRRRRRHACCRPAPGVRAGPGTLDGHDRGRVAAQRRPVRHARPQPAHVVPPVAGVLMMATHLCSRGGVACALIVALALAAGGADRA